MDGGSSHSGNPPDGAACTTLAQRRIRLPLRTSPKITDIRLNMFWPIGWRPVRHCTVFPGTFRASLRDELGKLDEWPQINGNEPTEMEQEG
ncbi:hypothetical protein M513_09399 [Trichuris suis]|uniref:Uncharacterized protein n=1 Tax=Trichuris suis TaxID=68888 RepID=A0A085LXK6_9BILA|nr:hypothetical protein M513_09399 [Trichuris suis]